MFMFKYWMSKNLFRNLIGYEPVLSGVFFLLNNLLSSRGLIPHHITRCSCIFMKIYSVIIFSENIFQK